MTVPILYEDDNYLIIDKPAGLMVHPDGRTKEKTLVDWILKKYPEMKEVGEPMTVAEGKEEKIIYRPGIVHRLDRETSGALVLAKTSAAFADLKEKFQNHKIQKIYHAIIAGVPKEDDGIIDRPIGRSARDFRQWSAGRGARGEMREAVTRWSVLARGKSADVTLVEAIPKTGRTHQIRAHFKAINHPIIGDELYAPKFKATLGIDRVALHSYSISFESIGGKNGGKRISATAPYPEDFAAAVKKLRK